MIGAKQIAFFRLALRNLFGYPMRTFLTALGVIFGVGSVIAMLALGAGAEKELLEEIGRLGIQNIIVNSTKPTETTEGNQSRQCISSYGLTFRDFRQIEATVPGIEKALPVHISSQPIWNGSRRVEGTIYAVKAEHLELFGLETALGRPLDENDGEELRRVCVIREGLLQELGIYEDPLDRPLIIGTESYDIIGVLDDTEFQGYAAEALAVDSKATEIYVPHETILTRNGTRSIVRRSGSMEATDVELNQIVISVEDLDQVLTVARMVETLLDRNHTQNDFKMVVPLEVLAQRRKTQQVFNYALVAIASISLLVGGIGIANIMLATVTERTKEIGIRRALGAKKRHIIVQFLTETTVISVFGGIVGVLAGVGIAEGLTFYTGWSAVVTATSVALALSISMAVGILSGIFPARRAALLDPIAALRHE